MRVVLPPPRGPHQNHVANAAGPVCGGSGGRALGSIHSVGHGFPPVLRGRFPWCGQQDVVGNFSPNCRPAQGSGPVSSRQSEPSLWSGVPAGPALDCYCDYRAVQRNRLVLSIFGAQQAVCGAHHLAIAMNRGDPVGPDPPQLGPIIGIAVDEHAGPWIVLEIGEPAQPLRRFPLRVDGGVDNVCTGRLGRAPSAEREYDRHQVGCAVGRAGGQSCDGGLGKPELWVEFPHAPAYAQLPPNVAQSGRPDVAAVTADISGSPVHGACVLMVPVVIQWRAR